MPAPEIKPGMFLVRFRRYGSIRNFTMPEKLAEGLGMMNGAFMALVDLGDCVVLAPVTSVDPEGFEKQVRNAVKRSTKKWEALQ